MDKDGFPLADNWPYETRSEYNNSDYDKYENRGYGYWANEMSQDHTFGVILGLFMVWKFVNDDYVKPNDDARGFYLRSEAVGITQRIIDYVSSYKELQPQPNLKARYEGLFVGHDIRHVKSVKANWCLKNPVNGRVVVRGPFMFSLGFAYPMACIANKMVGWDKYNWDIDLKIDMDNDGPRGYITIPTKNQEVMFKDVDPGQWASWDWVNKNQMTKLVCMSGKWPLWQLDAILDKELTNNGRDRKYFDLLYAVLNDVGEDRNPQSYYLDKLNAAGCGGIFNNDPGDYDLWKTEDAWSFSENHTKTGIFQGFIRV